VAVVVTLARGVMSRVVVVRTTVRMMVVMTVVEKVMAQER
jgi:hypothetical protein